MVVEELVALLGFEFDDKDLKKFDEGMNGAKKLLVGAGTVAVASAGAIFAFTKSIAETNDALGKQAQTLGMATAELQAWQFAAELGGSSAQTMTSSLESLSRKASEAARGMGAGVEVFGILGISATDANGQIKDSSVLLEDVADKVSQLGSQAQKLEFLEKLGISSDLLLTLDQGSAALRKQRLEAEQLGFTLSETATKDAAEFNDEFLRITKITEGVANAIGQELMPGITQLMTMFKEWFIANKKIIQQNFQKYLEIIQKGITVVWTIAKRLFNVVNTLVQAFGGWEVAIGAVGAALLLMNAKALMIPLIFIAIGIGIALLLEDLITYFQGGESAIGDLVAKFPLLGEVLDVLGQTLKMVGDGWTLIFTQGGDAIDGLMILMRNLGDTIMEYVMIPINAVKDALDYIANLEIPNPFADMTNPFADIEVSNPFASGGSLDFLNPSATTTPQAQSQAITSNNQTVSSPMTFNADIQVSGDGGDGVGTATSIRDSLDSWWADKNKVASRNLQGSVAR